MNHVILIGRLTKDPELRNIPTTGRAVANFTVAVDKNLTKDKMSELQQKGIPTADFIRINVWGKQAESASQYLSKGKKVAIEGVITTGSFKTNTGETRYTTEVTANHIEFLEKGTSSNSEGSSTTTDEYSNDFASGDNFDDDEVPF